jgi:hypothetical protein
MSSLNELQMVIAIQKPNYKVSCKSPYFIIVDKGPTPNSQIYDQMRHGNPWKEFSSKWYEISRLV